MREGKEQPDDSKPLRQRARERFQSSAKPVPDRPEETMRVVEELRIHQIELEIQNEDLRSTQQQLLESRENYRDLFEFAPVAYLTLDDRNTITEANHAAAQLLSTTHHRLINSPLTRYVEDQSLNAFYACRGEALETRASRSCEILVRHDTVPLTVLLTMAAYETAGHGAIFRLVLDDITQQKENERVLARSKEYVTSIVETVKTPLVVLTGNEFRIESVNGAFYGMFTATAEETVGRKLEEFKDGLLRDERLLRGLGHALTRGEDLVDFDFERSLPPTGCRRLLIGARRIGVSDLMREKVLLVVEDITDRKAAEIRIRELNEILRRRAEELLYSNKEMESFVYSVSHDLRAPLRAISGFTEIIREEYGPSLGDAGKEYLKRVIQGTDKMGRLIDDLLRLSRASRHELRITTVDLSDIVRKVLNELRSEDPGRKVEFSIQNGIEVHADPELLRIAVENLLQNAWKYTARNERTLIEFGIMESQGRNAFFIRDNGVGFRQEHAAKMFNPFQRLHLEGEFPGSGIGLAIVKRIIEKHGGSIWAAGQPGKGATVYFSLPL